MHHLVRRGKKGASTGSGTAAPIAALIATVIPGVTVTLSGARSAVQTTDANGKYLLGLLAAPCAHGPHLESGGPDRIPTHVIVPVDGAPSSVSRRGARSAL